MKDKKILYGIIILFIFLLSIGLTYAYFSVTTTVNGDRNDIRANAGILSILYTDGPEIVGNNINPGWTETKVIKVKNTGTLKAYYTLMWDSLTNEITNDELIVSATCTSDIGSCDDLESTPVGADELAIGVGIEPGEEQTYTLTFEFIEISSAQNYNQEKAFNGVLRVEDSLQTFALTGMLLDSNGDPIENAVIEVHSKVRTGITDENGIFGIAGVEVGDHELTVKTTSNEVIATDSITLAGGQSETISNKDIVADTNNAAISMTVKLGESSNIDTISTWNYEEACAINPNSLGCILYEKNLRIITNLNGGNLDTTFKTKYNKNSNVFVGYPYKNGYAFSGWTVSGTGATIENGILSLGTTSATLTANYTELNSMYTYTGNSTVIDDGNGNWRIKFLTSGTLTPNFDMEIDAFLVGGGGAGQQSNWWGGGGGGGGYTKNIPHIELSSGQNYSITIGAGGTTGDGGTTSAFNNNALGGLGGTYTKFGKAGGSGGGGGARFSSGLAGIGGSGGTNGEWATGSEDSSGGIGQGTTTYEFGDITGTAYAGGGGGGAGASGINSAAGSDGGGHGGNANNNGGNATSNTGSGGGGAGSTNNNGYMNGGYGGSGIVVIRNRRISKVGQTNKYYLSYTGGMTVLNEGTDNWKIKFLTSGTLTTYNNMAIDAFMVGGGGSGMNSGYWGGGGGSGGYTGTSRGIELSATQDYTIMVGIGGVGGNGTLSSAFNNTVPGGLGEDAKEDYLFGRTGGSGGGGGARFSSGVAGIGGSNGTKGADSTGSEIATGGKGQGITTHEFGETTGILYAGGGGGGAGENGTNSAAGSDGGGHGGNANTNGGNATQNTGSGGGGAGSRGGSGFANGGHGASGIVIIRNAIMPCVGNTNKYCFKYTGNLAIEDENTDNWKIKFLSSGTFTTYNNMTIDAFLVGGGGGGGSGAGAGGGGGYTTTQLGISLNSLSNYTIIIGNGGNKGISNGGGNDGGQTTGFGYSALGGYAGGGWISSFKCKGGNGGSGGGGGTDNGTGGAGGNDGSNGIAGSTGTFGTGQGTTTREFGEITGTLYGSGGGGGNNGVGSNGAGSGGDRGAAYNAIVNTGGGGGGSGSGSGYDGGNGGSGILIIRPGN